jgi:inhibitor of KinA sporulation pathway (predicted exonuclease)
MYELPNCHFRFLIGTDDPTRVAEDTLSHYCRLLEKHTNLTVNDTRTICAYLNDWFKSAVVHQMNHEPQLEDGEWSEYQLHYKMPRYQVNANLLFISPLEKENTLL